MQSLEDSKGEPQLAARAYAGPVSGFVEQFDLAETTWIEVRVSLTSPLYVADDPDSIYRILEFLAAPHVVYPIPDYDGIEGTVDFRFSTPNRMTWHHFLARFDPYRALLCRDGYGITVPEHILALLAPNLPPPPKVSEETDS